MSTRHTTWHLLVNALLIVASPYDVEYIRVHIEDRTDAQTNATVYYSLCYNQTIYKAEISAPRSNTAYFAFVNKTNPNVTIHSTTNCPPSGSPKVLIEQCTSTNAVFIDGVSFKTTSNLWYGISQICRATAQTNPLLVDGVCQNGYDHYKVIGIDTQKPFGFDPCKQLIYFDTARANQFIDDALMEDGSDIDPTTMATYLTTKSPTNNPTKSPTIDPTPPPSSVPYVSPTPTIVLATFCAIYSPTVHYDAATDAAQDPSDVMLSLSIFFGIISLLLCCIIVIGGGYMVRNIYLGIQQRKRLESQKPMIYSSENFYEALLVTQWLEQHKSLAGYGNTFINKGYYTLSAIKQITDRSQLNDLGIWLTGHQNLLLSEIDKLRSESERIQNEPHDDKWKIQSDSEKGDHVFNAEEHDNILNAEAHDNILNEEEYKAERRAQNTWIKGREAVKSRTNTDVDPIQPDEFIIKGDDDDDSDHDNFMTTKGPAPYKQSIGLTMEGPEGVDTERGVCGEK